MTEFCAMCGEAEGVPRPIDAGRYICDRCWETLISKPPMRPTALRRQVTEFSKAFKLPVSTTPCIPDETIMKLRVKLVLEEALEFAAAVLGRGEADEFEALVRDMRTVVDASPLEVNLVEVADALADLDYVVEGARLAFGIDGGPIADEVHRSNMAKVSPEGGVVRAPDGKVLKPEGWKPPDIAGELRKQGWRG